MNYIVIGCGRVGAQLAFSLFQNGHKVTIIDKNGSSFTNLPSEFFGRTIEGEASHFDVLQRAGIDKADGIAIVTNSDSLNAVIGHIAQSHFNLRNVVVRNYDPLWRSMIDAFEIPVVSSSSWGAKRIEELLDNPEIRNLFSAGNGELGFYEVKIPVHILDLHLSNLKPSADYKIIGVVKNGKAFIPSETALVQGDDQILISATENGLNFLLQQLQINQEIPK